ncbi:MAG: hypothetical protein MUO72_13150 [Bacteroidales bacterium]|nr:hypothetical protein [Bacteroidales bacterium]
MSVLNHIILLSALLNINCYGSLPSGCMPKKGFQDTPLEKQLIYNGRIWHNLYIRVNGDPFFLSGDFLTGNVFFNGREFQNLKIKYDICNDEVILYVNPQTIITLNKEMIEEFTIEYQNRLHHVLNMGNDSASLLNGYVNVLYDGPTALFVKYIKKVDIQSLNRVNDEFYQQHRIYIRKDSAIVQVSGRRELFNLLGDRKTEIRSYIKRDRLNVIRKDPDSFVPVLQFYDSQNR